MANTYLTRTFSSSGTSDKIWTWSAWIKRSSTNIEDFPFSAGASQREFIRFENTGQLTYRRATGTLFEIKTNRLFRDVSAWYHIVIAVDTSQSTDTNRYKLYVNGVQETSFATATYMSQNYLTKIGGGQLHTVGKDAEQSSYFSGSMSHVHFIDGTAYDATAFGEYDANGVWKIKTSPSVTYGTNGFFILKDGDSVTDQSGQGNDFTVGGGTLRKTEDCPSNNFCTWNPLSNSGLTLSNGNTYTIYASNDHSCKTTLGMHSGKYYWEMKPVGVSGSVTGICRDTTKQVADVSNSSGQHVYGMQYGSSQVYIRTNGTLTQASGWGTYVSGDVVQFAYDADNGKLFIGKNGTYTDFSGNTGNPANGTNPNFTSLDTDATWLPFIEMRGGAENNSWNFGNGYFRGSAVSSAGTNASGNGIFEYDVPTGFTALSTKGLNL